MSKKITEIESSSKLNDTDILLISRPGLNFTTTIKSFKDNLKIPTRESLGIANVDNTSDENKPLSIALKGAIANLANKLHNHSIDDVTGLLDELNNIKDRLEFIESSVDINLIRTKIQEAIKQAISTTDFNTHSQSYETITGLAEYITNRLLDNDDTVKVYVNALVDQKLGDVLASVKMLSDRIDNMPVAKHTHVIDDITGLRYITDRVVIAPLDADNGVIDDNW